MRCDPFPPHMLRCRPGEAYRRCAIVATITATSACSHANTARDAAAPAAAAAAATSSSASSAANDWTQPGKTLADNRYTTLTGIDKRNVADLRKAWITAGRRDREGQLVRREPSAAQRTSD